MELQFVGDIKAIRSGDTFTATGTLQSRRTGNYVTVSTKLDIPSLMAEARQVYTAARKWLAAHGQDQTINGLGGKREHQVMQLRKKVAALQRSRQRRPKVSQGGDTAMKQLMQAAEMVKKLQAGKGSDSDVERLKVMLVDEQKKQLMEARLRAEAGQRVTERQAERKQYDDNLAALKDQLEARDQDEAVQAQLADQAAQYEAQIEQVASDVALIQQKYETKLAQIQAQPLGDGYDDGGEDEQMLGMQFDGMFKNFKKALAVVFRDKIVKGLVKVAASESAGTKLDWKVPGLNVEAKHAQTWIKLL